MMTWLFFNHCLIFKTVTSRCNHITNLEITRRKLCIPQVDIIKVQVGNDQEKAQSEKDSHSKKRGVKKTKQKQSGTYTMKTYHKPNEQLFSQ